MNVCFGRNKKILVFVLTLCMLLTVFPSAAFASDQKVRIAMFGDSITWGTDGNRKVTKKERVSSPIPAVIAKNLYVTCDNYGVGSMGWLNEVGGYGKAYDRISSVDLSRYDMVTLCFGVNDSNYKQGSYNASDESTIMGQVNKCIGYLQSKYPKLKILVIAPFPTVASQRTGLSEKINQACRLHGVEFLSQDTGPLKADILETALPDKVHPSQEYYDKIGIWLANKIQSMTGAPSRTYISSVELKYASLIYNGSKRTQSLTTTVSGKDGKTLTKNTDYKITYENNVEVGKVTMTVTGKNLYRGTIKKTFQIIPRSTKIKSIRKAGKGKIRIAWLARTQEATGYKIQYSTDPEFENDVHRISIASADRSDKVLSGLKTGKTWYVRIRSFTKIDSVTYYSKWSAVRSIALP